MDVAVLSFTFVDENYYGPLHRLTPPEPHLHPSTPPSGWQTATRDVWRSWEPPEASTPAQGWKVHVSATLPRAQSVIDTVADTCLRHAIAFKHLTSEFAFLLMHHKHADRAQAGKLCTAYPPDEHAARRLLDELADRLDGEPGPYILSDRRYRNSTVVHYRYGGFYLAPRMQPDGTAIPQVRDGNGNPVDDQRVPWFVLPPGVTDPFAQAASEDPFADPDDEPRVGPYRVVAALAQSNAGGAYRAVDDDTGRVVFLKEARAHNGLHWDRTTAQHRLRREYEVLQHLHRLAPGLAPEPLDYFREWEHEFLVTEYIDGEPLLGHTANLNIYVRTLSDESAGQYFDTCRRVLHELDQTLRRLHDLGYRFGDVNPRNIVVTEDGRLRLIDFEACGPLDEPPITLGAPGYLPPPEEDRGGTAIDDYGFSAVALGVVMPLHLHLRRNPAALAHLRAETDQRAPLPPELWELATRHLSRASPPAAPWPGPEQVAADPIGHLRWLRDGLVRELTATAAPEDPDRVWPTVPAGYTTNTWCVAYGAAGVLHALHHAGAPVDAAWVRRLRREASARRDRLPPGLFFGTAGIAWVLAELDHPEEAADLLETALSHPLTATTATWGGGAAGVGATALALHARTGQEKYLTRATHLGDQLCATADLPARLGSRDAVGLLRGRAGVALFLHHLWRQTGEERYRRYGRTLLHEELDRAVPMPGDELGFMDDTAFRVMLYIAGGSAGVGHVLTRYAAAGGDERIAEAMPKVFAYAGRTMTVEPGLCRGLASLAYAYADHADLAGADDPRYRARAVQIATRLFMYAAPAADGRVRIPGAGSMRASGELWSGAAGVLLALDRLLRGAHGQFFTLDHGGNATGTPTEERR